MDWNINILQSPEYFRLDVLPEDMKQEVLDIYSEHIAWLEDKDRFKRAINGFKSAMNFMTGTDNSDYIPELIAQLDKLEKLRTENFFDVFPELERIKNHA